MASLACTQDRPNVLFISIDTTRADRLSVYGGPASVPSLDAVAERGLVYETAWSHFTMTPEEHWVLMTGVYPELHRTPGQFGTRWTGRSGPQRLAEVGYATGAFVSGLTMRRDHIGMSGHFDVYDDDYAFPADGERPGTETVSRAMAWMDQQDGPWFALVHLFEPHAPYGRGHQGSMQWLEQVRKTRDPAKIEAGTLRYDQDIELAGQALAPLLAAVDEDTLVVITSDHGESLAHDPLFEHSTVLHDEVYRVPLILAGPGVPVGREQRPVAHIDVMPTVLALVGVDPTPDVDGVSMLPKLTPRDAFFGQAYGAEPAPWSVRTSDFRATFQGGVWSGYDLSSDPGATRPIDVPAALRARRQSYLDVAASHAHEKRDRAPLSHEDKLELQRLGYLQD